MKQTEIRKKRLALDIELGQLEKSYLEAKKKIHLKQKELSTQCKHKDMNGGQYCRWCNDCGYCEDTT
jgi:hypothetical protein